MTGHVVFLAPPHFILQRTSEGPSKLEELHHKVSAAVKESLERRYLKLAQNVQQTVGFCNYASLRKIFYRNMFFCKRNSVLSSSWWIFWRFLCWVSFSTVQNSAKFIDQIDVQRPALHSCVKMKGWSWLNCTLLVSVCVYILLPSRTSDVCVYNPYRHLLVYICVKYVLTLELALLLLTLISTVCHRRIYLKYCGCTCWKLEVRLSLKHILPSTVNSCVL